jgi:hypothetical protein
VPEQQETGQEQYNGSYARLLEELRVQADIFILGAVLYTRKFSRPSKPGIKLLICPFWENLCACALTQNFL